MGLMDNLKAKLAPAKDKVSDFAQRHEEQVHHGLDRAARAVDERTKGKYSEKIHTGTGKAKGAMGRIAHHKGDDPAARGSRPPQDSPPPTT
ncbi:antitoxin [Streptomyces chartreusis]|uniref:antitoxin n=1 Tax=Streptomyces chartreusis TaxID=1969 RepID=UPI00371F99B9